MTDPAPSAAPPAGPPATPDASPTILRPIFYGTGSEYFGIWIINTLLLLVTLGLYYPWARARKLRYFAGGTELSGYRLAFTGVARKMFPGFALAAGAFVLYSVADVVSPVLSVLLLVLFAIIWPWTLRAALRFRMARTRWRGLPFGFAGSLRDAYTCFAPGFALALALAVVLLVIPYLAGNGPGDGAAAITVGTIGTGLGIAAVLAVPWLHFRYCRYQHSNLRYAGQQTLFTARVSAFYGLYLRTGLLALVVSAGISGVAALLIGAGFSVLGPAGLDASPESTWIFGLGFAAVIATVFAWQIVATFFAARLHNLRWSHTSGKRFAIAAALRYWPYLRLRIVNLLLKIVTLGLYIPFAEVAVCKMRVESIAIATDLDLDRLVSAATDAHVSAAADAAADLFDLDVSF